MTTYHITQNQQQVNFDISFILDQQRKQEELEIEMSI